jgi:hypothetical protein
VKIIKIPVPKAVAVPVQHPVPVPVPQPYPVHIRVSIHTMLVSGIVGLKRDCPCAKTIFRLSEKRTSPFESAGVSA